MTQQQQQFQKNATKDGCLSIPASTIRDLNWSPGATVYITTDAQTLIITGSEQVGKQHHTLTIHRRGSLRLTRFVLRTANIEGRAAYTIEVLQSESDGQSIRISAA